jgi:hypothetical protein
MNNIHNFSVRTIEAEELSFEVPSELFDSQERCIFTAITINILRPKSDQL